MNQAMIDEKMDVYAPELCRLADDIFDHPEMGYQEHYACGRLTGWLREHGWDVETGVGGLDTAFRAEYVRGTGKPAIGLLCEYDALKMGHACGHHMQGPIMLLVAQALRECLTAENYSLVIYGTPAEEGPQGKKVMIEAGCFRELDAALMTHAAPNTTVDIKSLAGSKFEATFHGVAAHASLTPELTRSALDAVVLAFQGVQFLRGHVREDVKFYTSILECSGTPNNNDETIARAQIALRTYQSEDVPQLEERLISVMNGAALMTGTTVEIKKVQGMVGKLPSLTLNRLIMEHARELDAPQQLEYRTRTGATDFAYVTRMMPAAVSRFAFVPEGTTSHSQTFLDYGKSPSAHSGMVMGAKILALTACDLIEKPETLREAQEEFARRSASIT